MVMMIVCVNLTPADFLIPSNLRVGGRGGTSVINFIDNLYYLPLHLPVIFLVFTRRLHLLPWDLRFQTVIYVII